LALTKPAYNKQLMPGSVHLRSGSAAVYRPAAKPASTPALDFAAIKKLVYKAASIGSSLTLPMLPPVVYPQPGNTSNSSNRSSTGKGQVTISKGSIVNAGLTLPMLPPVKGLNTAASGLTLPMLPPITCSTCGKHLQLLPSPGSSRIAAVVAAQPVLAPADQEPTCPMPSPRTCTAAQQQYKQYSQQYSLQYNQRYMLPQQQPKEKQRGTSAASCKSSSGGVLLVHLPPANTVAGWQQQQQASSSIEAASMIKQQLDFRRRDSPQTTYAAVLFHNAAPTMPAASTNSSQHETSNATAIHQAATPASASNSNSSSANVGAFASGSWVATWVSFPMLLPVEGDIAAGSDPKPQPRQQQQQGRAVGMRSNPWTAAAAATFEAYPNEKARTAARSTSSAARSAAAFKKAVPFTRAAAPAPYHSTRSFTAPAAVKAGRNARAESASASAASLRDWAARVNRNAAALLQPAQTIMQIVGTARSRSLQCVIPAASGDTSGSAFGSMAHGPAGKPSNASGGSGSGCFSSSAFAANSAAFTASQQLFSAALSLEKASWRAAHAAAAAAATTQQQQQLQSLCASVGLAHRELQAKLAAAVFKQHKPSQSSTAAALFSSATASAQPPAYSKNTAAAKEVTTAAATAAGPFAIPLGPVGALELRRTSYPNYPIPAAKPIAARAALQGPLLPLKQQLAAQTRAAVPAAASIRPAYAPARPSGVANAYSSARSRSSSSSSGSSSSVWMLNFGWDQRSAWAAAKAAAELGKAEASLQRACQRVLVAAPAAAAAAA
jgi:hypothetical protein